MDERPALHPVAGDRVGAVIKGLASVDPGATIRPGLAGPDVVGVSMRTLVISSLVLLSACTDYAVKDGAPTSAFDTAQEDGASDSGDVQDTAPDDTFEATWLTLGAVARVEGALAVADGAVANFTLADADLAARTCDPVVGEGFVPSTPPSLGEDASLQVWWSMEAVTASGCTKWDYSGAIGFGIGTLDPEVRARLGTVDLEAEADTLLGAWFSLGSATGSGPYIAPFPFGYARLSDGTAGDGLLADGEYTLTPLLLVAVPGE